MQVNDLISNRPLIISGPCSVSSKEQICKIAVEVSKNGGHALRAQLWKPRTKPTSFQGVGEQGIEWVLNAKKVSSLPLVMEVMEPEHVDLLKNVADVLWIGARNMQNFGLLKKVAKSGKPVILKRGLISNINEWLGAAEYIGLDKVILCERGIRTGADTTRFTLDVNTALVIKKDHDLPIIIDPSHTAGRRDLVPHLSYAAIALGVDGLVIEAHTNPEEELVDRDQTITIETLAEIIVKSKSIHALLSTEAIVREAKVYEKSTSTSI